MTDRFPLIVDPVTERLKELPADDNLDLTGNDIAAVRNIFPEVTDLYSLGSPAKRWNDLYVTGNGVFFDTASISYSSGDFTFTDENGQTITLAFDGSTVTDLTITGELIANGTAGAANSVLVSTGSGIHWSANLDLTNVSISEDLTLDGALIANGSPGANDSLLVTTSTDTFWSRDIGVDRIRVDTSGSTFDAPGILGWDDKDQSLAYTTNGILVDIGQENLVYIRNNTGTTLTKGTSVCVAGSASQRLTVTRSDASPGQQGCRTLGVVISDSIAPNSFGFVSTFGLVRDINTSAFNEGDELFISTTPGVLTNVPPESPARRVTVGYVVISGVGNGAIFVTVRRGLTVNELDNLHAPTASNGDFIYFDGDNSRYQVKQLQVADITDAGTIALQNANSVNITGGTIDANIVYSNTQSTLLSSTLKLAVDELDTKTINLSSNAYSNAIAYADGVSDAAFANAILFANTVANNAFNNASSLAMSLSDDAFANAVLFANTVANNAFVNAVAFADSAANSAFTNAVNTATSLAANAFSNAVSEATSLAANAFSNAVSSATSLASDAFSNAVGEATTLAGDAFTNAVSEATTLAGDAFSNAVSEAVILSDTAFTNAVSEASSLAGDAFANAVAYADGLLAASDAMIFKGTLGTTGTFTSLPTTHDTGWTIKVIEAGTYAGKVAEVGDMYVSLVSRTGAGNQDSDWAVIQANIDGAVTGPESSVDGHVAIFDGVTGKVIRSANTVLGNGTLTLATSGIATGSQTFDANQTANATFTVNVPQTNLGTFANTTTRTIQSSTGDDVVLPTANSTQAGVLTSTDKAAIDALGTISTQNSNSVSITGGTIDATIVYANTATVLQSNTVQGAIDEVSNTVTDFNIDQGTITLAATNVDETIDEFPIATFRTGKYVVSAFGNSELYSSELLVAHDGTTAYITEYALLAPNEYVTFTADIDGGNLRLRAQSTESSTKIDFTRTLVRV